MYNLVIIGVGKLGIRHLQASLLCKVPIKLHIIDVSNDSIKNAKEMIESLKNKELEDYVFSNKIKDLPDTIDLVIVATSANVRAPIIKNLIAQKKVCYMVLEKVLFQRVEDYYEIGKLLEHHNVKTWVNCPRRMMIGYKRIQEIFNQERLQNVVIQGGNWGLGCNSIHMIDLISYFIGSKKGLVCNGELLDKTIIESKRSGFLEFTGTLSGKIGDDTRFIITSNANNDEPIIMYFFGGKTTLIVKENEKKAFFTTDGLQYQDMDLPILFQSQLSNIFIEEILKTGDCELTQYDISTELHIPIIKTFIKHQIQYGEGDDELCMIT